jgi:hypothetical protein
MSKIRESGRCRIQHDGSGGSRDMWFRAKKASLLLNERFYRFDVWDHDLPRVGDLPCCPVQGQQHQSDVSNVVTGREYSELQGEHTDSFAKRRNGIFAALGDGSAYSW